MFLKYRVQFRGSRLLCRGICLLERKRLPDSQQAAFG